MVHYQPLGHRFALPGGYTEPRRTLSVSQTLWRSGRELVSPNVSPKLCLAVFLVRARALLVALRVLVCYSCCVLARASFVSIGWLFVVAARWLTFCLCAVLQFVFDCVRHRASGIG